MHDRRPAIALLLGAAIAPLIALMVALTVLTGNVHPTNDGADMVAFLCFGVVGVVIARSQPGNAIGWLLIAVAIWAAVDDNAKMYGVEAYRTLRHGLPASRVAVFWYQSVGLVPFLFGLPVVLLFPDGRIPSRRWSRWLLVYAVFCAFWLAGQFAAESAALHGRIVVDGSGEYTGGNNAKGVADILSLIAWLGSGPAILTFFGAFVAHQVRVWRTAGGERRQQLKWLMSGAALCASAPLVLIAFSGSEGRLQQAVRALAIAAIMALPISIGVGILKYRLYEIDRLISRTLSYALLTAMLAGVFVGIVVLATDVLPFSSPVGVAASTLAAAALFNPLRTRLQRGVDRRFNRARYDAQATVAAFSGRLRNATDYGAIRSELLTVVEQTVAPTHASLWINRSDGPVRVDSRRGSRPGT